MVASAVFITDLQGKSIISRNYRGDVPLNKSIENFQRYLDQTPDEQRKPIFHVHGSDFMVEEDAGGNGPGGETIVYVNVSGGYFLVVMVNAIAIALALPGRYIAFGMLCTVYCTASFVFRFFGTLDFDD